MRQITASQVNKAFDLKTDQESKLALNKLALLAIQLDELGLTSFAYKLDQTMLKLAADSSKNSKLKKWLWGIIAGIAMNIVAPLVQAGEPVDISKALPKITKQVEQKVDSQGVDIEPNALDQAIKVVVKYVSDKASFGNSTDTQGDDEVQGDMKSQVNQAYKQVTEQCRDALGKLLKAQQSGNPLSPDEIDQITDKVVKVTKSLNDLLPELEDKDYAKAIHNWMFEESNPENVVKDPRPADIIKIVKNLRGSN